MSKLTGEGEDKLICIEVEVKFIKAMNDTRPELEHREQRIENDAQNAFGEEAWKIVNNERNMFVTELANVTEEKAWNCAAAVGPDEIVGVLNRHQTALQIEFADRADSEQSALKAKLA
ncbi:MAG: hypothetical protein LBD32_02750, partial [Cytophagales bacterium]|nr:hypothetical protein [Cytophagales bacterium]